MPAADETRHTPQQGRDRPGPDGSGAFAGYDPAGHFDELLDGDGDARPAARELLAQLRSLTLDELRDRQQAAEIDIAASGITFSLYTEAEGNIDRAWPFDVIPRVFSSTEWARIEAGLAQRLRALNLFIDDLYHDQISLRDGIVPRDLL